MKGYETSPRPKLMQLFHTHISQPFHKVGKFKIHFRSYHRDNSGNNTRRNNPNALITNSRGMDRPKW